MGYCMSLQDSKFFIKEENKEDVLSAVKDLVSSKSDNYFSWVVSSNALRATNLVEMFDEWRWGVYEDEFGNIINIDFTGEKIGDDEVLFQTIAKYVEQGSFIQMVGEDGHIWRWFFDGEDVLDQTATISF
jgi:hypothetical protein